MFRFGVMAFLVILVGSGILSLFSIREADKLMLYVSGLLLAVVVLKLTLDLLLHQKKEDEDQESLARVLKEPEGKTFYDIEKFVEERRRKQKKERRKKRRA